VTTALHLKIKEKMQSLQKSISVKTAFDRKMSRNHGIQTATSVYFTEHRQYNTNKTQHSGWSESSRSYTVATGHRPERSDRARATPAYDRTPIEWPTIHKTERPVALTTAHTDAHNTKHKAINW